MNYAAIIQKGVNKAFDVAGSLAIRVELAKKTSGDYDFNTQSAGVITTVTKTIFGFEKRRLKRVASPRDSNNSQHLDILFKTTDIGDPSLYDTATINGVVWKITPPYDVNAFVTTVALVREL